MVSEISLLDFVELLCSTFRIDDSPWLIKSTILTLNRYTPKAKKRYNGIHHNIYLKNK